MDFINSGRTKGKNNVDAANKLAALAYDLRERRSILLIYQHIENGYRKIEK